MTTSPPSGPETVDIPGIVERLGRALGRPLEAIGLRRRRGPDGTLGPRRVKRLAGIIGALVLWWLAASMTATVPAGSVGVPVTLGHAGAGLDQGFHITWPFTTVQNMSIRTTSYTMAASSGAGDGSKKDDSVHVLGADGASGTVDSTVLYRVLPSEATDVYVNLGQDYVRTLIRPSARTCIRSVFTERSMVDAATTGWQQIEDEVTSCMTDKIAGRGIELEDFQLREVRLEPTLQDAVTAKTAAEQDAARQQFELAISEVKAEITRVDAKATADAQQILACGGVAEQVMGDDGVPRTVVTPNSVDDCSQAQLTPQYLQWTYIQALQGLVDSPNNSTVILPFDQNLTPLIDVNGPSAVNTTPPPSGAADVSTAPAGD